MKILSVHNFYKHRGGEDAVVEAENNLLIGNGHNVILYHRNNNEVDSRHKLKLALETVWSSKTVADMRLLINAHKPDVVHVHNSFPLISPSVFWVSREANLPVILTLHNFRLLCPQAMLLRLGKVCEDCLGHYPWRGALRGCYRDSVTQSTVLSTMIIYHRMLNTYVDKVTRFIVLNEFSRNKFIEGGLPERKLLVKPNFVDWRQCDSDESDFDVSIRKDFLFVGRLFPEKGISLLAAAMKKMSEGPVLHVVGSGPEMTNLENLSNVRLLGAHSNSEIQAIMCNKIALIVTSICFENFPRTIVEAFACGLPVIASRLGAMAQLIRDGVTGLLFESGNVIDLEQKIRWANANPQEMIRMGINARVEFEVKFTPEVNYNQLMSIYDDSIQEINRS